MYYVCVCHLIVDGPQEVDFISQGTNFIFQISFHQIRRVYILGDTKYSFSSSQLQP